MFLQPSTLLNQSTVVVSHRCMRHILHCLECVNVYIVRWSRGAVDSVTTRLRAGRSGARILVGARNFSLLRKRPDRL
jgi:hypothetical protein